ncbi:MAG: hypothetical protein KA956_00895 [Pyrinomonadaceae bacterium]|nr:n-acetylglutamate synthase [Acidobacteriota bacterium]MBK7932777.1 n-acetylglutamate synthase [Acidobacteriota bacterium]MBP7375010.1 hypothetical protein [Pyrinomonadaceae bacterium]
MSKINYDGRKFGAVQNSATGEVGAETVFHYQQSGNIVTAVYNGGDIISGHLIAFCDAEGGLEMRYHHINRSSELMTGICNSTPEILTDGRIRLHEKWQWTSGDMSYGESILEEIPNPNQPR